MKQITFLFLFAATILMVQAQDENDKSAWKTQLPRHDIQFGISDPCLSGFFTGSYPIGGMKDPFWEDYNTPHTWFSEYDEYRTATQTTGTLYFSYVYRVAKWCSVGATVSYVGFFSKTRDRITNDVLGHSSEHYITVMPTVRFSWFNRPCVTMYSGLAGGLGIVSQESRYGRPDRDSLFYSSHTWPTWAAQVTLFGIQAGRKWYGFAEIGAGSRSTLTAGFGYHFNRGKVEK